MFISGQPYTNFRSINLINRRLRLGSQPGGVVLKTDSDISSDKEVYFGNGSGTAMVIGYHATYGTTSFVATSNTIAVDGVGNATAAISGILSTSIIITIAESTAAIGYYPYGAKYKSAGVAQIFVHAMGATTAASLTVPMGYFLLHPQTK